MESGVQKQWLQFLQKGLTLGGHLDQDSKAVLFGLEVTETELKLVVNKKVKILAHVTGKGRGTWDAGMA